MIIEFTEKPFEFQANAEITQDLNRNQTLILHRDNRDLFAF